MAGRGREQLLPSWQTGSAIGGLSNQASQGQRGPLNSGPTAPFGWPQARPPQGGGGGQAPPWVGLQPGGAHLQGSLQRPPYGAIPPMNPAGFQPSMRPLGPTSQPHIPRSDIYPGPQAPYQLSTPLGGRPLPHQLPVLPQQPAQMFPRQPQMQSPVLRPPLDQPAQVPNKQLPKSAWTEHTAPDGRKYYYNAVSKTSSWQKPSEMQQPKAEQPPTNAEAQCDWKEFTAPDGRKYYYNRVTKQSKWQMPEELKQSQGQAAASKPLAKPGNVQVLKLQEPSLSHTPGVVTAPNGVQLSTPTLRRDELQRAIKPEDSYKQEANGGLIEAKKPIVYATKDEAKQAFKELLISVGTSSSSTWEATMRLIANDPRYQAFRTIGEKKACFNEFLQQRAREEKEEGRMRAKQARDDFITLLELSQELKPGMRYSKAANLFEDEPRWGAIKDVREREQLFNEHMKERERKEKEVRKAELKKQKAAFRSLLERSKNIKADTTWRKAQSKLGGEDEYEALEKLDRLEVFQTYIWDLEKEEKAQKDKEKAAGQRQERKNRDAFQELLKQHKEAGRIEPRMAWKEFHAIIDGEPALRAVEQNVTGSRPRELYEDVLEEVEDEYLRQKAQLREAKGLEIQANTSLEEFQKAVDGWEDGKLAHISHIFRKAFLEEEVGKTREKIVKEEKRRQRAKVDFQHLLRDTRRIDYDTSWSDARGLLEKEPEYKALDPDERETLYMDYTEKLKAKWEKQKEREKEREEKKDDKRARKSVEDDKPRKDKKRHKKDKHSGKEKATERKPREKDRHGAKRRLDESDADEEDRSGKRHRGSGDRDTTAPDRPADASEAPSDALHTQRDGQQANVGSNKKRGAKGGSDAEDGEL